MKPKQQVEGQLLATRRRANRRLTSSPARFPWPSTSHRGGWPSSPLRSATCCSPTEGITGTRKTKTTTTAGGGRQRRGKELQFFVSKCDNISFTSWRTTDVRHASPSHLPSGGVETGSSTLDFTFIERLPPLQTRCFVFLTASPQ